MSGSPWFLDFSSVYVYALTFAVWLPYVVWIPFVTMSSFALPVFFENASVIVALLGVAPTNVMVPSISFLRRNALSFSFVSVSSIVVLLVLFYSSYFLILL